MPTKDPITQFIIGDEPKEGHGFKHIEQEDDVWMIERDTEQHIEYQEVN
jgi:hypothetical protein